MVAFVWTYDHTIELVGVAVGSVAAVAGIFAAVFAIRGNRSSRQLAKDEARRWAVEMRPGVNVNILRLNTVAGVLEVSISNAGGAARPALVVACADGIAYGLLIQIGAHAAPQPFQLTPQYGFPIPAGRQVLMIIARDVEGTWWDIRADSKIDDPVPDFSTPEFGEWSVDRLRELASRHHEP